MVADISEDLREAESIFDKQPIPTKGRKMWDGEQVLPIAKKEGPSFRLHFQWKGKDSVMDCENLFKVKLARLMLKKQGIKSYLTEEEE